MGFLNETTRGETIYLELGQEPKKVRPLDKRPKSLWGHTIFKVSISTPGGQPTVIRSYATEPCSSTGRNGNNCKLCVTSDPLWNKLTTKEQHNRKGIRVDFPKRPKHLLPVWDYEKQQVRIARGGNQLFENMDKWYDLQPGEVQKDLRLCDWTVWKEGSGDRTKYQSSRMDISPFTITPEIMAQAELLLKQAVENEKPTTPEVLDTLIKGTTGMTEQTESVVTQAPPIQIPIQVAVQPLQNHYSPPQTTVAPVITQPTMTISTTNAVSASKADVESFTSWLNNQPELTGMGVVNILIPTMKKVIGSTDYNKCSPDQITQIKVALESTLGDMRKTK